jgi:hypothetical protein
MLKISAAFFLFSVLIFFSSILSAQDEGNVPVVHIQTNTMKGMLGDDADAFNEMLVRQAKVMNADPRVLSSNILRHFWGADSRDLVIVTEFKSETDLFSFYNDMNSLLEKAYSKEQLDADNTLWNKYVGQHSDEIYRVVPGTSK